MDFFIINNVMVNIPLGEGGYALSWIEAIGTVLAYCASGAPAGKKSLITCLV